MNSEQLITAFNAMADSMDANKQILCDLDGAIGDADHGVTMALGFAAVQQALGELNSQTASPADIFNQAAKSFLNAVGASAGPLYATAFMRAGAAVKGETSIDTNKLCDVIVAMAEGIKARGKAEAGDKTMLDAWQPAAAAAIKHKSSGNSTMLLQAVADAATQGAEATAQLIAKKGRAAKLGERSRGHQDPGAVSTAMLLSAWAESLRG